MWQLLFGKIHHKDGNGVSKDGLALAVGCIGRWHRMVVSWWPAVVLLRATRQANGHALFIQGYETGQLYSWHWR
jgi:hypothetical protein